MLGIVLHLFVAPWPVLITVCGLAIALSRWRLDSPWQLLDVALGGALAALLGGVFTLTWGMPWLDSLTGVRPLWKAPLYTGAGLLMGLSLPTTRSHRPSPPMWPGLLLGVVLVRGGLTEPDGWASGALWPCLVPALLWLALQLRGPAMLARAVGSTLVLASPAVVAAQLGMGRMTAGLTLLGLLVGAGLGGLYSSKTRSTVSSSSSTSS